MTCLTDKPSKPSLNTQLINHPFLAATFPHLKSHFNHPAIIQHSQPSNLTLHKQIYHSLFRTVTTHNSSNKAKKIYVYNKNKKREEFLRVLRRHLAKLFSSRSYKYNKRNTQNDIRLGTGHLFLTPLCLLLFLFFVAPFLSGFLMLSEIKSPLSWKCSHGSSISLAHLHRVRIGR